MNGQSTYSIIDRDPIHITSMTPTEALRYLDEVWYQKFETSPTVPKVAPLGCCAILAAHWAIETQEGKVMLNYNWANIPYKNDGTKYVTRLYKKSRPTHSYLIQENIQTYTTVGEGAYAFMQWLEDYYADSWDALLECDVEGYLTWLKIYGFFKQETKESFEATLRKILKPILNDQPTLPEIPRHEDAQAFREEIRNWMANLIKI